MALQNQYASTEHNVWLSTENNVWVGIIVVEQSIDSVTLEYAARKFYLTLTGTPDATTDVEIPISSFQGRRKNGGVSYLSVVTHDLTYADEIADRPNGELYIEMAYDLFGTEVEREEIIRVALETVVYDEGAKSQAITLSGTKIVAKIGTEITLTGQVYKRTTNESFNFRFADVDVFVYPGDTVTIGGDTFVPSVVSLTVSATENGANVQVEISE